MPTGPQTRPTVRLQLLGHFGLQYDQHALTASPTVTRLLAYLAVRDGTATREQAATALWPDSDARRAAASLRSTLWRQPRPGDSNLIRSDAHLLHLGDQLSVDLHTVHSHADALDRTPRHPIIELSTATLISDLLPDWDEEWLVTTREWFRQIRLRALDTLGEYYRHAGQTAKAMEAGYAAVTGDPLRESAHRLLARVHLTEGNPTEALRQYEHYRHIARHQLGIPPTHQFRELVAPLLGRPLDNPGRTAYAGRPVCRPASRDPT